MIVFGTLLLPINYAGIALVVVGFVALNIIKLWELRKPQVPVLEYTDQPLLNVDMLESKDKTFSQPRDD